MSEPTPADPSECEDFSGDPALVDTLWCHTHKHSTVLECLQDKDATIAALRWENERLRTGLADALNWYERRSLTKFPVAKVRRALEASDPSRSSEGDGRAPLSYWAERERRDRARRALQDSRSATASKLGPCEFPGCPDARLERDADSTIHCYHDKSEHLWPHFVPPDSMHHLLIQSLDTAASKRTAEPTPSREGT